MRLPVCAYAPPLLWLQDEPSHVAKQMEGAFGVAQLQVLLPSPFMCSCPSL